MDKWDNRFLKLAEHISSWSKDKHTKVGCVIVDNRKRVISTGYNGFPSGANDDIEERYERPMKYNYAEHAERNAIYTAANLGHSLEGKTMYLSGKLSICIDCARAVIQSGIKEIYIPKPNKELYPQWFDSNNMAIELLEECGVKVNFIN